MWWLGHLVLILLVFGLGISLREVIVAWRALTRFVTHGSEQQIQQATVAHVTVDAAKPNNVAKLDPFAAMQGKADADKLAALKAAMKPS